MSKPTRNDEPAFSVNHIKQFVAWLRQQPDAMRTAIMQDERFTVRVLRNIKSGRPPEDGGGTVRGVYGAPFPRVRKPVKK